MNKRQFRIDRIEAVLHEYFAAETAAGLLGNAMKADPSFGRRHGWQQRAGRDFIANLEETYIIRIYAEFEAGLRDYWVTYNRRQTHPGMEQLLNSAIPTQLFSRDTIDRAEAVRIYRNSLVPHRDGISDEDAITVHEAKKFMCAYLACLDPNWG